MFIVSNCVLSLHEQLLMSIEGNLLLSTYLSMHLKSMHFITFNGQYVSDVEILSIGDINTM